MHSINPHLETTEWAIILIDLITFSKIYHMES